MARPASASVEVAVAVKAPDRPACGLMKTVLPLIDRAPDRGREADARARGDGHDLHARARVGGLVADVVGDEIPIAVALARLDPAGRVVGVRRCRVGRDHGVALAGVVARAVSLTVRGGQRPLLALEHGARGGDARAAVGALRQGDRERCRGRVAAARTGQARGIDGAAAGGGRVGDEVQRARARVPGHIRRSDRLVGRSRRAAAPGIQARRVGRAPGDRLVAVRPARRRDRREGGRGRARAAVGHGVREPEAPGDVALEVQRRAGQVGVARHAQRDRSAGSRVVDQAAGDRARGLCAALVRRDRAEVVEAVGDAGGVEGGGVRRGRVGGDGRPAPRAGGRPLERHGVDAGGGVGGRGRQRDRSAQRRAGVGEADRRGEPVDDDACAGKTEVVADGVDRVAAVEQRRIVRDRHGDRGGAVGSNRRGRRRHGSRDRPAERRSRSTSRA